jgi:hypothetical protein
VDDRTVGAGSLGPADAEIELARFALELVRRGDDPERMASWIGGAAAALMARVSPECRAPTAERLQQLVRSLAGIELPRPALQPMSWSSATSSAPNSQGTSTACGGCHVPPRRRRQRA